LSVVDKKIRKRKRDKDRKRRKLRWKKNPPSGNLTEDVLTGVGEINLTMVRDLVSIPPEDKA
jgi:uncharacterized protein (UPF0218 family)